MKRIRYIKGVDGSFTSMQTMKGSNSEYKSVIYNDKLSGCVVDALKSQVVSKVTGTSEHKVKMALKTALEALGVTFNKETREGKANGSEASESNS